MDTSLALDPVVNTAGKGHHLLLRRFHPQRHTAARSRAWGTGNNGIGQRSEAGVEDELLMSLIQGSMRCIREEALQVQKEHTALPPIPAEVPTKLFLQTPICPVKPFPSLARSVIIYHAGAIKGYQDLIAQGLMDLPVCHMRGINRADFPTFRQGKVGAFLEFIPPLQYIFPAAGRSRKQVKPEVLCTLLPAYTVAALLPMEEHLPIGKCLLQSAQALTAGSLILQAASLAPVVSRLPALFARHNMVFAFRTDDCRVPNNLRGPNT